MGMKRLQKPKPQPRKRPRQRKRSNMSRAGSSKTFINTLGEWELQEDGSVRLIREATAPKERRVKRYASSDKRNRVK